MSPPVLPAVLPNGNAQANTEQHERAQDGLLTWTGRHQAAPDGRGNTDAVRLIIRRLLRVQPASRVNMQVNDPVRRGVPAARGGVSRLCPVSDAGPSPGPPVCSKT